MAVLLVGGAQPHRSDLAFHPAVSARVRLVMAPKRHPAPGRDFSPPGFFGPAGLAPPSAWPTPGLGHVWRPQTLSSTPSPPRSARRRARRAPLRRSPSRRPPPPPPPPRSGALLHCYTSAAWPHSSA